MGQKIIIESLAMDLKRVALGTHRGSTVMANRFKEEALKRADELESQNPSAYIKKLIAYMREHFHGTNEQIAENSLMLSTLFQNFTLKNQENI